VTRGTNADGSREVTAQPTSEPPAPRPAAIVAGRPSEGDLGLEIPQHSVRATTGVGADVESRDLARCDIPRLADFAPEEWGLSLDTVLFEHLEWPYFHALVLTGADRILAVGHGIMTRPVGWIGNVIVRPEVRRRGLGARITRELMDWLLGRGCRTLVLIATPMGEPVYRKLGFRTTGEYVFLRLPRLPFAPSASIERLQDRGVEELLRLDAAAIGEARRDLLQPYLAAGWGHVSADGSLDGFFLPSFGAGYIAASRPEVGLELLVFKHALYRGSTVIPAANHTALRFLIDHGAEETARAPRMEFGDDLHWRPEWIYSRASGYSGETRMNYEFTCLTENDRAAVVAVFNYFVGRSFAAYPEDPVGDEFFDRVLSMSKGYPAVSIRTNTGEAVGFGFLRPFHPAGTFQRTAEIAYFVLPEHTGRGLGRRMLSQFVEAAKEIGIDNLLASVSSLNEQSLRFHDQAGFERCGTFRAVGRKFGREFDVVWFQKRL